MRLTATFHARDRAQWRSWLATHHGSVSEVWLVFYRAGTRSIRYDDAVAEALCFGWIDSILQRIDSQRYARKFTPRRPGSKWSAANIARVRTLLRSRRMTPAGLRTIAGLDLDRLERAARRPSPAALPASLERTLRASADAWRNFQRLAPGQHRLYIAWITAARRDETRRRRLAEAITKLERNEPLGMK